MRFEIYTLVDVTNTNARRGDDVIKVNQQANYNTLYNTLGLRTNPTEFVVSVTNEDVKDYGFGSKFKGKQNIWKVEFVVEAEDSTSIELMNNDFDLVPIINNLTETVKLEKGLFITHSNHGNTNVVFNRIDK